MNKHNILILAATGNEHKIKEFLEIFKGAFADDSTTIETLSQKNAAKLSGISYIEPEENGTSFGANSKIKAEGLFNYVSRADVSATELNRKISEYDYVFIIADDSGLSVDALNGRPGIFSARYAAKSLTENANDEENLMKVLEEMKNVPDDKRDAHFTSAICAIIVDAKTKKLLKTIETEGYIYGRLTRSKIGENGFGYDPIFFVPKFGKTTAELTLAEKTAISHRGIALREAAGEANGFISTL